MSYCLNPSCSQPENTIDAQICQSCGISMLMNGRYRVLQALGQGGFGATYLARDEKLPGQPNCVIKQLRPNATAPHVMQMARELFEREAQTLGRIGNHPQVPRLLDYFEACQEFYLVQEYVSGATLQQEVKRNGPFTEAGVKQFLSEILPVVEYLHNTQVIHRDIKPANLIRRSHDKKLVMIDFGAVKNHVNSVVTNASEHTAFTSYAIGTPGFAPPEQMAMRPVFASDIYALGVTCVYLLTGKSPKDLRYDPSTGELMWRQQVQISDHFAGVLQKMLEVSVRHRYQNAPDVFRDLDLEPYLDSLAGSLNSVSNRAPAAALPRKGEVKETSLSPLQRTAMAIRSRQQVNGRSESTSLQSGGSMHNQVLAARPSTGAGQQTGDSMGNNRTSGRTSGGRTGSPTGGRKEYVPVDGGDVVLSYAKGRRDFADLSLEKARMVKTDLSNATFHRANLRQANFTGSILIGADFGRAGLVRASLRDTNLTKAYLSNADLEEADLRGADLRNAYLLNANLRGANLGGANLTGAKLSPEQLAMARTNWMTIRPDGKRSW
jgi:serine/threonine protein kinase, bacterial